jgi:rhodanese-related sulfurtransferase
MYREDFMTENVPRISREVLRERPDAYIILDLRSEEGWNTNRYQIPGARRETTGSERLWLEQYPENKTYVLYCDSANEGRSARTARIMTAAGYPGVYALKDGWSGWCKANYPVEEK